MDADLLTEMARRRDGVIALSDADELGVSRPALAAYARRHGWRRMTVTVRTRRSRTLRRCDAATVDGVPVTSPPRTLCDLAAVWIVDALRSSVIDARQRRLIDLEDLADCAGRLRATPGISKVRRVLRDLDTHTSDSPLEWDFRMAARARGFRPWPRPFPFRCSDGVVIEIDVAFPGQWVAVECDSYGFHADRSSLVTDHLRQNRAVADGWRPFRVDWTRLKDDTDRLFAELAGLLAAVPPRDPPRPAYAA